MGAHRRTRKRAGVIAATASSALLAGGLVAVTGPGVAAADTSELTLTYSCPFPLIGSDDVVVTISADIPPVLEVGEPSGEIQIDTTNLVGELATQGLNLVGGKTLTGTGVSHTTVTGPGTDLPLQVPVTLEDTEIPASGSFETAASGTAPSFTFDEPGEVTVTVNELDLTLTPLDANGQETGLGTFEANCVLSPAEQDNVLFRGEVVDGGGEPGEPGEEPGEPGEEPGEPGEEPGEPGEEPGEEPEEPGQPGQPIDYAFDLDGESYIDGPNGTVPLSGDLAAQFDLISGEYTAQLNLEPTKGDFSLFGFIPTAADVVFEQTGDTTGTLIDGKLLTESEMYVYLTSVKVVGLPLAGGENCRTKTPSSVSLESTADFFNPLLGGHVTGDYELAGLENCGLLNPFISIFTSGPDNTIDLDLIPAHG